MAGCQPSAEVHNICFTSMSHALFPAEILRGFSISCFCNSTNQGPQTLQRGATPCVGLCYSSASKRSIWRHLTQIGYRLFRGRLYPFWGVRSTRNVNSMELCLDPHEGLQRLAKKTGDSG